MSRTRRILPLVLGTSVIVAACGGGSSNESAPGGKGLDQIRLFYAAPLTGGASDQGIAGCQGAELAMENINAEGGIAEGANKGAKLKVECLDTELSTDVVATIANRYIAEKDVWSMFGFYSSGEGAAAGKVTERAGLSVIASNIGADFLTKDADNIVVMLPQLRSIAYGSVVFANKYYGATKFGDVSPDFSFMESFRAGRDEALAALPGTKLATEQSYPGENTQDFGPYLTKANSAGSEVLLVGSYPPEQCQIASQARRRGLKQPILDWTTTGTGASCIEAGGDAYVGLIFGEAVPPATPGSAFDKAGQQFAKKHGTRMTGYAAFAYDSVLAVKFAVENGAESREDLLGQLAKLDEEGLAGPIKFNKDLQALERSGTMYEATGMTLDDLEPVGSVKFNVDGTAEVINVAKCADRPTCQLNR